MADALGMIEWMGAPGMREDRSLHALEAWAWSGLAVAMMIYSDTLKFLGEAERYLEFALLPMIVLSLLVPAPLGTVMLMVILGFSVLRLWAVYAAPAGFATATDAMRELVRWFAEQRPRTIFAVRGRLCFPICYRTAHRAIWWFMSAPREPLLSRWKALFGSKTRYPYVDPSALASAHVEYGADTIILDKAGAQAAKAAWGFTYDLSGHSLLFENEEFLVFDARPQHKVA